MTKRKIKTVNRKTNGQTKELMTSEESKDTEVSTETWHKMNMWYLAVERNVHTSHSW